MGADINFYVGIRTRSFSDTLGPHGIDNRNLKGKELLYLYKTNNLKLLLSFFKHTNYITYRSFSEEKSPHMLDNFITCSSFFKRTKDCKVIKFGVRSDHAAIKIQFRLTAMKFSNDLDDITIIYWKKIQTENAEKAIFNDKLEELASLERDYTTFNANIIQAGLETATQKKTENRVCSE